MNLKYLIQDLQLVNQLPNELFNTLNDRPELLTAKMYTTLRIRTSVKSNPGCRKSYEVIWMRIFD